MKTQETIKAALKADQKESQGTLKAAIKEAQETTAQTIAPRPAVPA